MVQDAANLAIEDADQRGAARDFRAGHLFDRQTPGMFLVHRRDIVEAVKVRKVLEVRPALHQLLSPAVEEADMRVRPLDNLAVQFQHHAQHAMRRRVLGPEVDVEVPDTLFRCFEVAVSHDQLLTLHAQDQRRSGRLWSSVSMRRSP